ncbi:hypothetical protein [Bosea sp. AS-1]|uniref:hypothetical protein n=1 Tax=Bosea sp. AS-1 TaxID=2015316 RepID=UPI000B793D88|nr:hypothetical protein [Bosea sp. AS-1]
MTTVVLKDKLSDTLKAIRELAMQEVKVGLPQTTAKRDEDELNNPTIAYIHEYGAPGANIPARPFLIPGVRNALPQIEKVMKAGAIDALDGKSTANATLNKVGLVAQGSVQQKIVDGPFVPNKPETIRRKGSNKPLIDTGALRQAVNFVIEDK